MKAMVKSFLILCLGASQAFAAPLSLTPQDVTQLVLKQSLRAKEIGLQLEQVPFDLSQAESLFDYKFAASYGQQQTKFESSTQTYFLEDTSYLSSLSLTKPFITGTTLGVEYLGTTTSPVYSSSAPSPAQDSTNSLWGFSLEQDLWRNSFGTADRATLRAAENSVKAARYTNINELQDLVLGAIRSYWVTFVAQETFKNSVDSRDRYAKLVASIKRKAGYGYTGPGELSQAQAELEDREQKVKSDSVAYLTSLDQLVTLLQLPAKTEIQFNFSEDLPPPPKNDRPDVEQLRPVRASQLNLQASEEALTASQSLGYPDVSLVGRYYAQGLDESAGEANREMTSGQFPRYYVGVKLEYQFGSNFLDERTLNRKLSRDLAQTQLQRQKMELEDKGQDIQRRLQSTYAIAQSSKVQRELREKAARELARSYQQGRTDIAIFIDALNNYYTSAVQYKRSIGDYQFALSEWSAFQDRLVVDSKSEN
ncbi:MAG: TolC family protein [Pseudobdellovibrionaceae bacterium]